ncbi:hypothetical protein CANCADRAFT_24094 [Tortispora caseinolytica NRRL Y-17796]|uniref:CDP-diacylglycerol--glycerol-3-phosphate 3-phosphatidyltransferase n=1 Tax=Tortispora caseinolytica NRRL Y-17796 TaxID=767744 RepID=A0A1E4TEM2_9ASCO|nr:hypothetical protein CANCADRAFT_24094 [Tortispora caseinolytica NRRL Y-17796]
MRYLDNLAPKFFLGKGQVEIISLPVDFYETLKQKISTAKRRIFLSTLYIGPSQHELVNCLRDALLKNRDLQVTILIDALRGTREHPKGPCSASLLVPLVREFPDRVAVRLYHTPNLSGLSKKFMPRLLWEGKGVQHQKAYGFDDTVILSGANLSTAYFTIRQDRYYMFHSAALTDYYLDMQKTLMDLSFDCQPSNENVFNVVWPDTNIAPNPVYDAANYKAAATLAMARLLGPRSHTHHQDVRPSEAITVVYPISQLTPILDQQISTEHPAIVAISNYIANSPVNPNWWLTAGYFNVHSDYSSPLFKAKGQGTVIVAAPEANGFFGARGPAGYIAGAYLQLTKKFYNLIKKNNSPIDMLEWRNGTVHEEGGWSYHAKGIWATAGDENPVLTLIGSSNYTMRSHSLDLESNVVLMTSDPELQRSMRAEVDKLTKHCTLVTDEHLQQEERAVPASTRVVAYLCGNHL